TPMPARTTSSRTSRWPPARAHSARWAPPTRWRCSTRWPRRTGTCSTSGPPPYAAWSEPMARFIFVVPPFAGHVNPTIPVAAVLTRGGHEVAWAGLPGQVGEMLPEWGRFIPAGSEEWAAVVAERNVLRSDLRGAAAYKFLLEE